MRENVDNFQYLYSDSVWYEDGQIWLSAIEFNGLYRYDMEKNEALYLGGFPNEANDRGRLHGKIIKVLDEIYFLPDTSKYIHVYNIKTETFSAYDMDVNGRIGCRNGFYYKGKVYFVCGESEIMLCNINIATKKIEKQRIEIENREYGISVDMVLLDDKLYFACRGANVVVEYSCKANAYKYHRIGEGQNGFGTICYDGKAFWLTGKDKIIYWDKDMSKVKYFERFPERYGMCVKPNMQSEQIEFHRGFTNKYSEIEFPFWFSAFFCGKVWLFPYRTNMILQLDIETGDMEEFCLKDEDEDENSLLNIKHRFTHCHYLGGVQNNMLIFVSTKSKKLRMIRQDDKSDIKEIYLRCKEPSNMLLYLEGKIPDMCCEDGDLYSLKNFIEIL